MAQLNLRNQALLLALVFNISISLISSVYCPPRSLLGPCSCSTSKKEIACFSQLYFDLKTLFFQLSALYGPNRSRSYRKLIISGHRDHPLPIRKLEDDFLCGFKFEEIRVQNTLIHD